MAIRRNQCDRNKLKKKKNLKENKLNNYGSGNEIESIEKGVRFLSFSFNFF
jgi:hypothetical protein